MTVLIDTHTFLWMAGEPEKLSPRARDACESADLVLSVASVWEMAIKWQIGRLALPKNPHDYISKLVRHIGISIMPVHYRHALAVAVLPAMHKDPFDRMLAAQCIEESLPCVTRDSAFALYGVEVIW